MLEKKNCLSKEKWEGTCLLNQRWGKEIDTWWKVGTWKFADKVGRELILIILMFSLIFRTFLSSSNVAIHRCGLFQFFYYQLQLVGTSRFPWHLYIPTPPQFSICRKYRWVFCLLFSLALLQVSFEFLILFLHCNKFFISSTLFVFSSIPYFITSSWLKAANVFFSHINKCVSLHRRI